jgi:glycosyltransferase involved in cell wall biosynthesis
MDKQLSILYFIQLPPPLHGVSITNQQVFSSILINENFEKILLEIKFSNNIYELRTYTFKKFIRFFCLCFTLIKILIKKKPDLVYFSFMPVGMGLYRDAIFALIMKLFRRKIIFHIQNRGMVKNVDNKLISLLYQSIFNNSFVIHISKKLINEEFSSFHLNNTRFYVVPNGVKAISSEIIRSNKSEKIRLIFLSNLFVEKGIFDLLEVYEDLCLVNNNILLSIIGAPTKNIENEIKDFILHRDQIKDKIIYHGPLYDKEKQQILVDSDIFVFPSYFSEECFPLSLLDAMAAGLPIIATNIGAIDEIIRENENGFIFEARNKSEMKERLQLLIHSEDLRYRMGQESYKIYNQKYTLNIFEHNMKEVFNNFRC